MGFFAFWVERVVGPQGSFHSKASPLETQNLYERNGVI